jgi:hypothetical protein
MSATRAADPRARSIVPVPRRPKWHDRIIIAGGEDAQTRSKRLDELLDRIAAGEEPVLSAQEVASLGEVRAGKFKYGRGQHRGSRRFEQGVDRDKLLDELKEVKEYLKRDPKEQALKREYRRLHKAYVLNDRTAEVKHGQLKQRELARQLKYGDDYVETRVPSVASLRKKLRG